MRYLYVALDLPAVLVLFLPFGWGVYPHEGLLELSPLFLLAAPAFLALLILASTVRQLVGGALSKAEVWIAYGLASSTLVATVVFTIIPVYDVVGWRWLIASASAWVSVLAVAALCVFNLRRRVPHAVNAHVCLLCAYLPNAIMAIVLFGVLRDLWDVGAYVCMAAVAGYVLEIVLRVRQALRSCGKESTR